jgi:hypothetical protein
MIYRILLPGIVLNESYNVFDHVLLARLESYFAEVDRRQLKFIKLAMIVLTFIITIWLVAYFRKIPSSLTLDELCYFSNRVKKSKFTPIADYYVYLQSLVILYIYSESNI